MSNPSIAPWFSIRTADTGGVTRDDYFSDADRLDGNQAGSAVAMEGRMLACEVRRTMFSGVATRGPCEPDSGEVQINNADGKYDDLIDRIFDGQDFWLAYPITVSATSPRQGVSLYYGVMEQPEIDFSKVAIAVHDSLYITTRPALPVKYAGTNVLPNGIEGVDDLKDQPKPMLLGQVFNATPRLVNTSLLIYQVEGQAKLRTGWTLTVKDKGVALVQGADYVDQTDMETNAPAAGQYRVCPTLGCFRLGSTPAGQVTFDGNNPVFLAPGYSYLITPAMTVNNQADAIVRALISWAWEGADPGLFDGSTVYSGSKIASNFAPPAVGMYLDAEISCLDAINQVSASVSASWVPDTNQNYQGILFNQLREGGSYAIAAAPVVSLLEEDIISIDRVLSADDDRGIPVWKVNLGYARNYTVQTGVDVAGAALADLAFVSQEYRYVTSEDATVKTHWPNAKTIEIKTLIVAQADAQAEADRLLALYKVRRDILQVKTPLENIVDVAGGHYRPLAGQDVTVTHPRFSLSAGRTLRLISYSIDALARIATLTLWG